MRPSLASQASASGGPQVPAVRIAPTFMSMLCFVWPGFAPAGEALLFRQKAPKPVTPRLTSLERTDANLRRGDQLAGLTQGPPVYEGVPLLGQTAGVGA